MEIRHIRYFVAVAEELNFTRAAEKLHTAQPSLSKQIRDLEIEVGAPLLTRTKRSVALTEAGRAFLDEARLVLAQAQRALTSARRAAEAVARSLTIGFVPAAEIKIFPSTLTTLRARFPDTQIVLKSLTTWEQKLALERGEIDVGFLRPPVDEPNLGFEEVLTERIGALLPADHPAAAKVEVRLADLADTPFLRISPLHAGGLSDVVDRYIKSQGVEFRTAQNVENVLTLMSLVSLGHGFSIMPDYIEHLVFRNVAARPFAGDAPNVPLVMAWRRDDDFDEVRAFRDLVSRGRDEGRY